MEESVERGGELREEVTIVYDGDEIVQGLNEPMHEEGVPNQSAQQVDHPTQTLPSPRPADDPMIEDTKPT